MESAMPEKLGREELEELTGEKRAETRGPQRALSPLLGS